jgi:hypothetical protein
MSTYNEVEGFRAQEQMISGAARVALTEDSYLLFQATMRFVKRKMQ